MATFTNEIDSVQAEHVWEIRVGFHEYDDLPQPKMYLLQQYLLGVANVLGVEIKAK